MSAVSRQTEQGLALEGDGSLNEIFSQIPLDRFRSANVKSVFTIPSTASVSDACELLSHHNILSAPIRDVKQPDNASWMEKYIGVADFLSTVDWMMNKTWGQAPANLSELRQLRHAFSQAPVTELSEHARWSPFIPIDPSTNTTLDVMLILGKYGAHRVWLVDTPGGDITGVITQSTILDVLVANLFALAGSVDVTLASLGLGKQSKVVCVRHTDTYWDAFQVISQKLVSAVPIVDHEGKIKGAISAHDLRDIILDEGRFKAMALPIGQLHRHQSKDPVTCKLTDTLEQVIRKLQYAQVHRLFVTDDVGRVTGVVSLRDVIAQFVREPAGDTIGQYFEKTIPMASY